MHVHRRRPGHRRRVRARTELKAPTLADILEIRAVDFGALVRPGDRVAWGQGGAEPVVLTAALMSQRTRIGRFQAFIGASFSPTPDPAFTDVVGFSSYCGTGTNRNLARAGALDIIPSPYSRLAEAIAPIDVLLLQVAPPRNGAYSLGIAHEYLVPLIDPARLVIAEVNDRAPWTHGDRALSEADIDVLVPTSRPPLASPRPAIGPVEEAIARQVAGLVEDGSTLQLGLGAVPEAILRALQGHRDLGIHSGTISDGVADLMEAGVVTNARKPIDPGTTVTGLMLGGERIYRYADGNRSIRFASTAYTHDPGVLSRLDRFVALNAAIEVDLTGQINAEVAAGLYVGAVGGAGDFLRAAHRSRGGLPVVALPSTGGRDRASRIVARLSGPVSTCRSDAGLVVTEHGVADLRGRSLAERRRLMIDLAHPDFRAGLDQASGAR